MTPSELSDKVTAILSASDSLKQIQALRRQLSAELIPWLDALVDVGIGISSNPIPLASNIVVVLLHGMLTEAVWQSVVADEIRSSSAATVYPVGYGWFDVVRFWLPGHTRNKPLEKVLRELRDIQRRHLTSQIVVIAHSFSTYLVSKILVEHKDVKFHRLLLCGSIIPIEYRWDKAAGPDDLAIVNEVGTQDIWPIMARVSSWGYGCSGTMGFKTNRVEDRYFNHGHSGFFDRDHVKKYWMPFVTHGKIESSPWSSDRHTPSIMLSAAGGWPHIKLTLILISALLATVVYYVIVGIFWAVPRLASFISGFV